MQWLPPFEPAKFRSADFGLDAFLELCFGERLIETSPFVALTDKDPRDLWDDAPAFLATLQLELAAKATDERARLAKETAEQAAAKAAEDALVAELALASPHGAGGGGGGSVASSLGDGGSAGSPL